MTEARTFWARRRAGVAAEAKAEAAALEAEAIAAEQAQFEDMSEAEILEALDLPEPETLGQGDDFKVFMAKAVPDQIRRRALRALWRSNPVLANVDMLVDYGDDFTDSAMAVDNIQTAYQVGKGMLKHVEEMARQAEAKREAEETPAVAVEETVEEEVLQVAQEEEGAEPPEAADLDLEEPDAVLTYAAPAPRRMRFTLEDTA